MRELLPVTDAGELCLGDVVYKARTPGQAGYALPERYKSDPDQRDYYHVGVVTATSPLEITHCTSPGIVRDTKLGKWTYRGRLKKVGYDSAEGVETMAQTATVVADSGDDVKMRSTPSQTDGLYWKVPVGAEVQVAEIAGGWAKVRYGDRTGYMMAAFLDMDGQEAPEEGGSAESVAGGGLVTVQRAALQEVYDALGSILQGG
jgi:SH3 domain protein